MLLSYNGFIEHFYFLILEMFLWTKPRTIKIFGIRDAIKKEVPQRLRGGTTSRMSMGVQYSMLNSAIAREAVSPDHGVKFSRADFVESNDDNGNSWQMRTRSSIQSWRDLWRVRLQDKYRMVFLLQQDIESFKGKSVKETEDFKMAEERMYGMASEALSQLDEKLNEVTSAMKSENVKIDDLSEYMYALHAEERNKVNSY